MVILINKEKKGTPVYCGADKLNSSYSSPRYWQWPYWNKETYYFLSNTNLSSKHSIKTKIYYDIFKNSINSFDDATYTTQKKPSSFKSMYNDYTYGGSLEYGTTMIPKNDLKFALHYKEDVHRENNLNEPVRHIKDNTVTIGLEDNYRITEKWIVIPGVSFSSRKNTRAEDYDSKTNIIFDFPGAITSNAYNGQLGIFYYPSNNHKIGGTYSHKTRFATIKDRYSYRMGTAIPNPDLKPEIADNYEINYAGNYFKKIAVQTALFYSNISDAIMSISNIQPGKSQMKNSGKAEHIGVEASLNYQIIKSVLLGANYTYIEKKNLTTPGIRFTDVPNTKVVSYVQYQPINKIRVVAGVEYNSSRFSTSYGTKADAFTLVNTVVSWKLWRYISLEAGVNNLFDKNYCLVEGYPEEGRNFFITLRFFNHN